MRCSSSTGLATTVVILPLLAGTCATGAAPEKRVVLNNDRSDAFPCQKTKRTPLVTAISSDGAQRWHSQKVLEDDPNGWYCYMAIHITDDAVLLGYCAGDVQQGALNRLRLRRISREWLKAKPAVN